MSADVQAITVTWALRSDTFHARAGRGKAAAQATCTSTPSGAVRRAAAKFFHVAEKHLHLSIEPSGAAGSCTAAVLAGSEISDPALTPAEAKALQHLVDANGMGDVFSPLLARTLRALDSRSPGLITLTNVQPDKNGTKPYFGAVVTAAGRAALEAYSKGGAS